MPMGAKGGESRLFFVLVICLIAVLRHESRCNTGVTNR